MFHRLLLCMLILTITAVASTTAASAATFEPARIGEHDTSLAKLIRFPEVPGNYTLFVRCEAKVMLGGTIKEIGCYNDSKVDTLFFRAVSAAAGNASVLPARVDGENVNVLMLLSVVFRQQDGAQVIAVIPNHGTNAKELGMSYIAPQRYGQRNQYFPRSELGLLWVDARMDKGGKPKDIEYIETDFSNKETSRYAEKYMANNTFIPGFHNGEAVDMRFVKPIFGYRNGFMWDTDNSKCRDTAVACDERSNVTGLPRFVFDD